MYERVELLGLNTVLIIEQNVYLLEGSRLSGVMGSMLASILGQTNDYEITVCCFTA
jgi:hypothetical protein